MSLNHSPSIVTNGLVFAYDMANTQKSFKGAPTTNLLLSPSDFTSGNWIKTMNSGTIPSVTSETIPDRNGNIKAVDKLTLPTDGTYPRIYQSWTPASTATHTFSIWMKIANGGSNTKCEIVVFRNSPWASPSGVITANLTTDWQRFTVSFAPLDTTSHQIYIGSHDTAKGTVVYMDDAQLEVSSFATPFAAGTRSNAQALIDLTGNNTITATSLTYASDGTFSFNGSSNSITVPFNSSQFTFNSAQTIIIWMKNQSPSSARRNPYNQAYAGGGTITHENDTSFNYFFGTGGSDNSPYTNITSSFSVVVGETAMICLTRDASTVSWFKNGTFSNSISNPYGASVVTGTNNITIGSGYAGAFGGNIYAVQLYNRALSAAEVKQNFNALRGRYGI